MQTASCDFMRLIVSPVVEESRSYESDYQLAAAICASCYITELQVRLKIAAYRFNFGVLIHYVIDIESGVSV